MLSFKEIEKIEEELKCLEEEINQKEREVYLENNKIYKPHPVIYHMADIHITNKKERYEEYQQIFEKIYKLLENDVREKIIVICGDLYDNKTSLKTNSLTFVSKFIGKLSKYGKVILINGNHDLSMVDETLESTIESMLTLSEELDKNILENIHYLNEDKVYKIKGINFVLTKMFSKKITKIVDKKPNELYVGLYHGKVYGAKTDLRYSVTEGESNFITSDFNEYDITLLGDIHKHQFLDKNKRIAYPSSLVQKHIGETVKNHGLIIWDLNYLEGKFVPIPNDYCICKCTLDKNEKIIPDENINLNDYKYITARIEYEKDNINDIYTLEERLKKQYPNIKSMILYDKVKIEDILTENNNDKIVFEKISEYMNKYIEKTLHNEEQKKEMKLKCEEIINKNSLNNEMNMKKIELISMEFEDLFCYGKNNRIDFSKLNKIVGINGDNGDGKSSIIDTLIYCLYQETSKSLTKVINRFKKYGWVRLFFRVNDELYLIYRKINAKNKTHTNTEDTLNFIKVQKKYEKEIMEIKYDLSMKDRLLEENKITLIHGKDKGETKQMIIDIFGSKKDLTENNILLQDGETFINKTAKERKKIIFSIFGIKPIDDFYSELTSIITSIKSDITKETKTLMKEEIKIKKTEEIKLILEKITKNEIELEKIKLMLDEQYFSEKKLNEILGEIINIDHLKKKNYMIIEKINSIDKELEKYEDFLKKYNNDLNILVKEIEEQRKELIIEQNYITKEKNKIIKIQEIKDIDVRKKTITDNLNYIKKLENEKENYEQEYELLIGTLDKKTVIEINNEIKILKKVLIEYKSSKKILDEYKKENKFLLEHKFNLTCTECKHNKKIHENINYMGKINELNEYIISNMNVEEKIQKYEKILSIKDKLINIDEKIIILKKEITNNNEIVMMDENNKKNIDENNKIMLKIKQMEIKYNNKNSEYENMMINYKNIKFNKDEKNKLEIELEKIINIIKKYEENSENIQKLKNNLIDKNKNMLNKKNLEIEIKKLEKEKTLLENDFNENEKKQKELDKKVLEKNSYERIHNLFIIDKILDKKINTIINNLESIINNILKDLTDFTLKFDLSVDGLEIYKVKDDEIIDARVLSGYEKFSANLAMRIAFCKLNEYTRSNFLIIDEGFTSSSQNNLPKMETLFDAIRKYFKWCITVSHLDQIKSNYDFTHTIKKIKCGKTYDSYINI
jgi:DNA repair exonuclease SbcCD ATPase subunit